MTARWDAVRAWREALTRDVDNAPTAGLSPEGRTLGLTLSLSTLTDDALEEVARMKGRAYDEAGLITAATVSTAAIEWLAVLLGRGTEVMWRPSSREPGLSAWLARHAAEHELPLHVTQERHEVVDPDLVVAMGSDETVQALRAHKGRTLAFGARTSLAWWRDGDPVDGLMSDLAAHDSRGCMTPAFVVTDARRRGLGILTDALHDAERRWPRGRVSDAEHAQLRARASLAQASGTHVRGDGWQIDVLPAGLVTWAPLPRALQVIQVPDAEAGLTLLGDLLAHPVVGISALGTNDPDATGAPDDVRICRLGEMQAPPLVRRHDGVDHLRLTLR